MGRREKLTDAKIRDLKAKPNRYVVPDPEVPGLYVRVTPAGRKTFTIVSRDADGKQVWRDVEGMAARGPF